MEGLLLTDRLTSGRRAVRKDYNLEHWISPKKTKLEAIVVMLWHRHRLNLSAVVLPIGHALSWFVSRKIRKATNTLQHILVYKVMKLRCMDMRIEEINNSHIMHHREREVEKGSNAKILLEISVNFAYKTRKNIITQNKRSWDDTIAQKMFKCLFMRAMQEFLEICRESSTIPAKNYPLFLGLLLNCWECLALCAAVRLTESIKSNEPFDTY